MPTLIDSLVIELGIDPAKLTAGARQSMDALRTLQEQGQRSGKDAEAQGKKILDFFTTLKRQAVGFAAALMGGKTAADVVSNITNLDATIGRLSRNIGMSTEDISSWVNAVKGMGGDGGEAITTLTTVTTELQKFRLGMGDISGPFATAMTKIGGLFQDGKLKDAGTILLQIAEAFRSMPREEAFAWLQAIPGMTQSMSNLIQLGPERLRATLDAMKELGGTTRESAAAAEEYQASLAKLETSATSLGRSLLALFLPALNAITSSLAKLFATWNLKPDSPEANAVGKGNKNKMDSLFGNPRDFVETVGGAPMATWLYGSKEEWEKTKAADRAMPTIPTRTPAKYGSQAEREAYIRAAALKRGIDPDIAMAVARSEGFFNYIGDNGTSFGDFQLHYKNNIPGLSNSGLGDSFTKQTGLDARDPSTWRQQADYALDQAAAGGWGPWHGWKGPAYAGIGAHNFAGRGGAAGSTSTTTVSVQNLTVNSASHDAAGIAGDIKGELERQSFVGKSMYGQW